MLALRSIAPALISLTVVSSAQAAAPPPAQQRRGTYVVKAGESLSTVARRTGVSIARLAHANGIADVHRIRAGDRLVVPTREASSPAPAPTPAPRKAPSPRLPARLLALPERLALLPTFDAAAKEFGVPADLLKAITWQESGWQNDKVSSTKARGIGQLMPDTVEFVNRSLLRARLDPARPEHNIRMSARFLAYLLDRTRGDARAAVSAYYQGLGSVQRKGPYPSTRLYADDVLALRSKF